MMKTISDPAAVTELTLYAENTQSVYNVSVSVIQNLQKKYNKGIFDKVKAVKAFEHVAEYAAKEYIREFKEPSKWCDMFNASTRRETAKELLNRYMDEITEDDEIIPLF